MKNTSFILVLSTLLLLNNLSAFSQNESTPEGPIDPTLKGQFQEMLDKSESYSEHKVIKRSSLNEYSKAVQDSLNTNRMEINSLKNQDTDQKSQIAQLSKRISDLEAQLAKSEELRESLSLLGIQMNKVVYHFIVWILIIGFAGFGLFAYTSFVRSNMITAKTKKEYATLEMEFDEHKKASHEKQIKTARDLQTERNTVEELKAKLKAKTTGK